MKIDKGDKNSSLEGILSLEGINIIWHDWFDTKIKHYFIDFDDKLTSSVNHSSNKLLFLFAKWQS